MAAYGFRPLDAFVECVGATPCSLLGRVWPALR